MRVQTLLFLSALALFSQGRVLPKFPPVAIKQSAKPAEHENKSDDHKNIRNNGLALINEQQEPSAKETASNSQAGEELRINRQLAEYTGQLAVFTKWLVLVGSLQFLALVVQGIIFGRTLAENRKAIQATEQAANASAIAAEAAKESNAITKEATELTRSALHLTERADLLLEAVEPNAPGFSSGPIHLMPDIAFTFVFKNRGRTRANQITTEFWIGVPGGEPFNPPTSSPTVLGPGGTLELAFRPLRECLSGEAFIRVADGKLPFRLEGQITYRDVFGERHTTRCGGTLIPETCRFRIDRNEAE